MCPGLDDSISGHICLRMSQYLWVLNCVGQTTALHWTWQKSSIDLCNYDHICTWLFNETAYLRTAHFPQHIVSLLALVRWIHTHLWDGSYQSKIYRASMSPSTVKAVSKAFSTVLSVFIHVICDRTGGVTICCRTHQDNPSFGCGKLHQDPFVTVWSPQAEPVPFRQPDRQQTSCNNVHLQTGRAGIGLHCAS